MDFLQFAQKIYVILQFNIVNVTKLMESTGYVYVYLRVSESLWTITVRISNGMREGNAFTGVCPSTPGGGGKGYLWQAQLARSGQGGTPHSGMGYPPARSGWGTPRIGQQKEYLLRGGRYASCVHAGGLSCF